ncbi:hypothetical protein K2173_005313 [Erythroxylum novogranatense]|uniref:Oxidative stress 3 n=1 Tax=Erythroxylum novogranatense TaxID=1862640 RepID=A0AAV8TIF2_9ROSI|nr:hypothetical protein K2173_005313 [Erythroxylum novogranatense]
MSREFADDRQILLDLTKKRISSEGTQESNWVALECGKDGVYESTSIQSSMEESTNSVASSCSKDLEEDASSPISSSSSTSTSLSSSIYANGPLYDLSKLITQLPIKRGLSKFYQGKSQSYTSLGSVKSIEDLAKKATPHRSKMKSCKSYAGGLDGHNKSFSPKPTITKRASSRGSFLSSSLAKGSLLGGCESLIPVQIISDMGKP